MGTIEHRKTATNLSKPIKNPKFITQQPTRTKVYTVSKAADRMLQLDVMKRRSFPKKWLQRYKIKILNYKQYDHQLNFTEYAIKNKLYEINKKN